MFGRVSQALARAKTFIAILIGSGETADEAVNRSRIRYRRAFWSAAGLALFRLSGFVSTAVLVPVLYRSLGPERFGLWMAMSSVFALLSFADLGLGHGVMTSVASATGQHDRGLLKRLVSSGYVAVSVTTFLVSAALVGLTFFIDWSVLLKAPSVPAGESHAAIVVLIVGLVALSPLALVTRIQSGMQQGYVANLWMSAGSIAGMSGVLLGVHFGWPFPVLMSCFVLFPALVNLMNTVWFSTRAHPDLRPRTSAVDRVTVESVFRTSFLFFILQASVSIAFFTDNILLAAVLGADAVPTYAVPARLFAYITLTVMLFLMPLWPAYAEAFAQKDFEWIRRTFRRSMTLAVCLSSLIAGTLFLAREPIFRLWVGADFHPDARVIGALALWSVLESTGNAWGMLFNGLNVVKLQVAMALCLLLASLVLRYTFLHAFGVWGLPVGTICAYAMTNFIPSMLLGGRLVRRRLAASA